jgi:hypothetical protein
MAEKPILFSTEMVRAILEGKKTQTRRVFKPQPPEWIETFGYTMFTPKGHISGRGIFNGKHAEKYFKLPWQPMDVLWVRETWCDAGVFGYAYRATDSLPIGVNTWRPAIHMPREAARLLLQVKDVRVERLQDILPCDIQKEGCPYTYSGFNPEDAPDWKGWFRELWDSINAKRGYGWDTDPWVWVIRFEVLKAPADAT